jgi:hypothetical protein
MRESARVLRLSRGVRVALARPGNCSSRSGPPAQRRSSLAPPPRPQDRAGRDPMAPRGRSAGPKARATSRFNKFCESATCRSITSVQPGSGLVRTSAVAEEGGLGNALRGSLSDRLRLTTGLLTSSLSASSSAEGQSIAWRAPAEVTMSRTARRAGSPRPPARAGLVTTRNNLVGFPERSGKLQPMPEPGRRTSA